MQRKSLARQLLFAWTVGLGAALGCVGQVGDDDAGTSAGAAGSGTTGTAGTVGTAGSSGSAGNGTTGSAGTGTSGSAGTTGTTGTAGTTGATGRGGTVGTAGTSGSAGATGAAGRGGTTGTAGTTGAAGRGGTTGTAGTTGSAGRGGTTGTAGTTGSAGRGGTTGTAGTTGSAGRGGTTGTAGTTGSAGSGPTACSNLGPTNNGNGSFTWYYFGQGTPKSGPNGTYLTACGYMGSESGGMSSDTVQYVANMSPANAGYFAAIPGQSGSNFDTNQYCGACVQVTNGGKSIIATIIDECPEDSNAPCKSDPNGHLDLSWSAWNALGYPVGNPSGTTWKVVPCPITGNVITRIKSGNPNQVFVENSVLAITGVSMNGSSGQHLSYGPWQVSGNVAGQTLTLTDKAGRTLQVQANGSADQSNDTGKQFPACQ